MSSILYGINPRPRLFNFFAAKKQGWVTAHGFKYQLLFISTQLGFTSQKVFEGNLQTSG